MPWLSRLSVVVGALLVPVLARADEPRLAPVLKPFVDQGVLAGAVVLVATPERVLDLEAVGYSDVVDKIPMKTDALFWIASMSKPMTATALMMLVDEGTIALDDPVEKYLPEFHNQMVVAEKTPDRLVLTKPKHPITIREILSHTSGLVTRSPIEKTLDSISLREGVITYALSPLQFEPGTRYEYCNAGINTAGRLIEVVSGLAYEDFLRRRLLDPLGMKDTTFWPSQAQVERLAKSYQPDKSGKTLVELKIDQLAYPLTNRKRHPYPAGGLFSTATDVALFCRMILQGGHFEGRRYLSEKAVREMTSTQTGTLINKGQGEGGYGLGWSTSRMSRDPSGPAILGTCGHGGAYATNMEIDPKQGLVLVYMVQHAGYPGGNGGAIWGAFHKAAYKAFAH